MHSLAQSGISLRVTNSRLLLRRPGYTIKPHRDPRWAFLTALVYLPVSTGDESYGTQLYRLRHEPEVTHNRPLWVDRSDCELVKEVAARGTTALVFLNSTGAHGASIPSDAPADTERYLYQVHFGVDEETQQRLRTRAAAGVRSTWANGPDVGYH